MRLAQYTVRAHAHAFLDGVLPEPDQDYSALPPEDQDAYKAGRLLRGKYPRAECREPVGEDGIQRFEVHDDSVHGVS